MDWLLHLGANHNFSPITPIFMNDLFRVYFLQKSFKIYQSYFLRSHILEALSSGPKTSKEIKDFFMLIVNRGHDDIKWSTYLAQIDLELLALIKLGFIDINREHFFLNEVGINANRTALYQSLAANTFFAYKSLLVSFWSLIVALVALIVSFVTIFK